ncbi:Longin-like domain-containing protein [Gorgonomyces haynaldii]|nr:Longin-like domain-containing protein [Gorgonomyces haynaldii]
MNFGLKSVESVCVLDAQGTRLIGKYYNDWDQLKQTEFEKKIFQKKPQDVVLLDGKLVLAKTVVDVLFVLVGNANENEILLHNALGVWIEALQILLKNQVEKRVIMDSLDVVLLSLDELVDDGVLLEFDPQHLASRVTKRGAEVEIQDQSLSQVWRQAQEQLTRSFLK